MNPAPARPAPDSRVTAICVGLALMTFAVFAQTLGHGFVNYDDDEYVTGNPEVLQGLTWHGVIWAFTGAHAANWHPLTWLSHMLDCQLFGLHPAGHHLMNVVFHIATVIGLFLVLREMTGALWRSAFVAAIFAIHPLRVGSVAWISERKDVLSGLFFVLTIGAYTRYVRSHCARGRYVVVILFLTLGLLSKPMLVTVPLVLLLLDYWPLERKEPMRRLVAEKIPLLALSALSCVATLLAQRGSLTTTTMFPISFRLVNAVLALKVYLGQMVYPAGLAVFYPMPRHGLPVVDAAVALAILGVISFVAWKDRKTSPWLLTGWAWYCVMLVPVLGIVQVGLQAHADRYTYLPQIGIYLALTWMAADWAAKNNVPQPMLGSATAVILGVCFVCSFKEVTYWKNSESLWNRALAVTTDNFVAHLNLASALVADGRVGESLVHYEKALELQPDYMVTRNNYGYALEKLGKLDAAIAQYERALKTDPNYPEAELNLGNALRKKGSLAEAITHYDKALKIRPNYAEAHFDLANALGLEGKMDEAIEHYKEALRIVPGFLQDRFTLAVALTEQGRASEALPLFLTVLDAKADDPSVHLDLGLCYQQLGQMREALDQYIQALHIKPGDPGIQINLAWLLATCPDASLRDGLRAVELARNVEALTGGKDAMTLSTLAAGLAETGRFSEAVETAQRALRLVQNQPALAAQIKAQLKFYQAGQPFRLGAK